MKNKIIVLFLVLFTGNILLANGNGNLKQAQNGDIRYILRKEKNPNRKQKLVNIINYIDGTYSNLYGKLKRGEKIVIFFDPAHGKDSTERWRGHTTNRFGVTGKPEEYYSIIFSRKLYSLLKANPHIKIVTSKEFQKVLDGKSESYHYLRFKTTVALAKRCEAFMIISEHMNNVSIFKRADGFVNLPGLHIVRNKRNRKILTYVNGSYSGYLTLYNKYDGSGFSKAYAKNIKNELTIKGYKMNSWDYGAVGDDRFTYYADFPVSVIYENGFISHPVEEALLRDPYYIDGIIRTQYDTMLKTFREVGGVDISGPKVKSTGKKTYSRVNLLKLNRLAIFYIQAGQRKKAETVIRLMKKRYGKDPRFIENIRFYSSIQKKINHAERLYKKGLRFKRKRWHKTARRYYRRALASLNKNCLYYTFKNKYRAAIRGRKFYKYTAQKKYKSRGNRVVHRSLPLPLPEVLTKKHRAKKNFSIAPSDITKPVIIAIENNDIRDAIKKSLAPDSRSLSTIADSMDNYSITKYKKKRVWSKRKRRRITKWYRTTKKYNFRSGIYIVKLRRDLTIESAKRVSSVYLNENRYQNQQFLKNSYFGNFNREKAI